MKALPPALHADADKRFLASCALVDNADARVLAVAVLLQALRDAMVDPEDDDDPGAHWEARAFCLEPLGPWAESRGVWCDIIGLPESTFRGEAARRIALKEKPPMPPHACAAATQRHSGRFH